MVASLLTVLVYGLALYGLFLLTLQLARRHSWPQSPVRFDVNRCPSLLLVVRDQAAIIEGLVRDTLVLYHSSLPQFDLVIVDAASGDDTPEILRRLRQKHSFIFMECGRQESLLPEFGLRACQGEIVCYIDLTGPIDPRPVSRLVRRLVRGEMIGAGRERCEATLIRRPPAPQAAED